MRRTSLVAEEDSHGQEEEEEKERDKDVLHDEGGEGPLLDHVCHSCVLHFQMSSLLDKSSVCALLLQAFSDGECTSND